jgi:hypothetical protein
MGTTTWILHATLRFLLRDEDVWPSYTALLPPGLPLYHLLCLGLFPYEAFLGEKGREVGGGRGWTLLLLWTRRVY